MNQIQKARSKQNGTKRKFGKQTSLLDSVLESSTIVATEEKGEFSDIVDGIDATVPNFENLVLPEGAIKTQAGSSLWNDKNMDMPEELKQSYKTIGEKMYDYDYGAADIDSLLKDTVEYALTCLKSGLDPKDLDEEELEALEEIRGPTWFLALGLTEEEVYGNE